MEKKEWDPLLDGDLGIGLDSSLAVYEAIKLRRREHDDEAAAWSTSAQMAIAERDDRNVMAGLVFSSDEPDPIGAAMADKVIAENERVFAEEKAELRAEVLDRYDEQGILKGEDEESEALRERYAEIRARCIEEEWSSLHLQEEWVKLREEMGLRIPGESEEPL